MNNGTSLSAKEEAEAIRAIERLATRTGHAPGELAALIAGMGDPEGAPVQIALRLRALGVTEAMLRECAPPVCRPARTGVELHGTAVNPRAKWTCGGCAKRNDTKLQPPIADREPVVCKFCKRHGSITFTRNPSPPAQPEPTPE